MTIISITAMVVFMIVTMHVERMPVVADHDRAIKAIRTPRSSQQPTKHSPETWVSPD